MKLIKTVYNPRLAYLVSLDQIYKEQGYKTKLDGFNSVLEVFEKEVEDNEAGFLERTTKYN